MKKHNVNPSDSDSVNGLQASFDFRDFPDGFAQALFPYLTSDWINLSPQDNLLLKHEKVYESNTATKGMIHEIYRIKCKKDFAIAVMHNGVLGSRKARVTVFHTSRSYYLGARQYVRLKLEGKRYVPEVIIPVPPIFNIVFDFN